MRIQLVQLFLKIIHALLRRVVTKFRDPRCRLEIYEQHLRNVRRDRKVRLCSTHDA